MKSHIVWSCEFCHKKFDHAEECEEHEATHYGLTYAQYKEWKRLRGVASSVGAEVGRCKNPETDSMFDKAIQALVDFEKCYGLMDKEAPNN